MGHGELESKDPCDQRGEQEMSKDIRKSIMAVGEPTGRINRRGTEEKKVRCQGCGKFIRSDGDLDNVEYVKTKRGSTRFFHSGCFEKVWKRKIC